MTLTNPLQGSKLTKWPAGNKCIICNSPYLKTSNSQKVCKNCYKTNKRILKKKWIKNNPDRIKKIKKKEYLKHRDKYLRRAKDFRKNNPDKMKQYDKKEYETKRKRVLDIIGNGQIKCVYCGCDNIKLLEINHKNGGGTKELKKIKNSTYGFYYQILNKKRKCNDLEITCRVCNARHYLEMKYGKLPFKIIWNST